MAESVTITDNRSGQAIEVPIVEGGVSAAEWAKLMPGIWFYDPGLGATAECESAVTFIDGDAGILEYRGYPIEQLAEQSSYLESTYLLLNGQLPSKAELEAWTKEVLTNAEVPSGLTGPFLQGFQKDAHPMGILQALVAALSTYYPESKQVEDAAIRHQSVVNLIAKVPTLAAAAQRHGQGLPAIAPDPNLGFAANFLNMVNQKDGSYVPDERLARALDVLFILHADHEQNASTTTMRVIGSTLSDPYASASGAVGALYGPRHGGANEAVLKMLAEIGSLENVPDFIRSMKEGHGVLQGFGHRVYKNYDPRAKIVQGIAYEVFEVTGKNPLLDVALKLEEVALADEYFISRRLYPNVDFYSGIIYQAMGFPVEMFTLLFAVARMSGWLTHWQESIEHKSRITRPRQIFTGPERRDYVPMAAR